MEAAPAARRRPGLVTAAVVLVYLSGFFNAAIGLLILLSRYQAPDTGTMIAVSLLGAGTILFGLLTITVGSAAARGSRLARLLVTIYLAIQIALHIVTIVTTDPWDWWSSALLLLEVLTLLAFWVPRSSRRFYVRI
ncbi:hypothetical protein ABCS02_10410 [Microbacterium sp. X-17]|uniref:hypothetical protein n=1 Tax=Microbacterium sp. X-17 TaxID=3144404 RepID=UPI0031F588B4